jgi:DNA-binding PadR family transcriptional regulator
VAVPFFHSSANNNQIYKALLSLHRAGLVEVALHVKEKGAASKVYSITAAGEAALKAALAAPPEGAEYYSHFHQQLAFAHTLTPAELATLFAAYETKTRTMVAIAQELRSRCGRAQAAATAAPAAKTQQLLWEAIFDQRVKVYELELAWLQETRDSLSLPPANEE